LGLARGVREGGKSRGKLGYYEGKEEERTILKIIKKYRRREKFAKPKTRRGGG